MESIYQSPFPHFPIAESYETLVGAICTYMFREEKPTTWEFKTITLGKLLDR